MAELVLVAHGTRSAAGVENIAALAEAVSRRVGSVRTAFVDVLGPTPSEVLSTIDGPAVLLPAFLASGYHVHHDIPEHVAVSGHPQVAITQTLGPDPVLASVLAGRLRERAGAVVMRWCSRRRDPLTRVPATRFTPRRACSLGIPVPCEWGTSRPESRGWPTWSRRRVRRADGSSSRRICWHKVFFSNVSQSAVPTASRNRLGYIRRSWICWCSALPRSRRHRVS